jgi:hypothetical protein
MTWFSGLFGAQGLALDSTYLYWANGPDQIGQVKLDGTGLNPAYILGPRIGTKSGSPVNTPVPMVVSDGYLYRETSTTATSDESPTSPAPPTPTTSSSASSAAPPGWL